MFNISRQSYLYGAVALITSIINLILLSVMAGSSGFVFYLIFFLVSLPFLLLYIYGIDCLTTGGCETFSWIVSILAIIYMIATTIIIGLYAGTKETIKVVI